VGKSSFKSNHHVLQGEVEETLTVHLSCFSGLCCQCLSEIGCQNDGIEDIGSVVLIKVGVWVPV
jgi:hypothetical protein